MNQLIFRSFKADGFWLECPPSPAAAMHCGYLFSWPTVDLRRPQLQRPAPQSSTPARQSARQFGDRPASIPTSLQPPQLVPNQPR